jgi:RNA polymerase sigma-70 factor (ECF subfamily)
MDLTTLILSAQHGDLEAFNQLVLIHQERLFNFAANILLDDDAAEDAVQNALILAYRNLKQYRGGSFPAWLFSILRNVCLDEIRRRKRSQIVPLNPDEEEDETAEEHARWMADESNDPVREVETAEFNRALTAQLARLPSQYRLALVLIDMEGFDYGEAAQIAGVPLGTIKSRLARARVQLCRQLREQPGLLPERYIPKDIQPQPRPAATTEHSEPNRRQHPPRLNDRRVGCAPRVER